MKNATEISRNDGTEKNNFDFLMTLFYASDLKNVT
jgi:hypothetical protein